MRKKLIALSIALLTIGGSLVNLQIANAAGTEFCNGVDGTNGVMVVAYSNVTDGSRCTGVVVIPEGVNRIVMGAFRNNAAITGIDFSQNTTLSDIGAAAFWGVTGVVSIEIPGNIDTIHQYAFARMNSLQTVVMLEGVRRVLNGAFALDTSLIRVVIPNSVTTIGGNYNGEGYVGPPQIFWGDDLLPCVTYPLTAVILFNSLFGFDRCNSLTLPPDFLTPKTYGNPASVTGYAPALPATPVTPTAPVITASATSVIYNGVPQSAAYSVDQESSCSTTYNDSPIPPVAAGSYAVSITCSANSLTSTATTTLTITKASPVISWSTPGAITTATKLSSSQLNAFSYIPGSFTYSSAIGSTLPIGDDLITATFTPTDSTNYTTSTMTVTIHVTP